MTHMIERNQAHPELTGVRVDGMTRGSFILRGALATSALYGTAAAAPFVSSALAQSSSGDVDILNFALTLEYLEAAFYQQKGKEVGLTGTAKQYAADFGDQEAAHVSALTAAIKQLGGTPVAKPTFDFPVHDQQSFLALASTLENTGVGAYNGAAPMISGKAVLASAGEIVQVEARHAAAIDLLVGRSPTPNMGFDKALTKDEVLAAAGPLIKTT
jgi:hypothetical protein